MLVLINKRMMMMMIIVCCMIHCRPNLVCICVSHMLINSTIYLLRPTYDEDVTVVKNGDLIISSLV